jgi:hypothetical protein
MITTSCFIPSSGATLVFTVSTYSSVTDPNIQQGLLPAARRLKREADSQSYRDEMF